MSILSMDRGIPVCVCVWKGRSEVKPIYRSSHGGGRYLLSFFSEGQKTRGLELLLSRVVGSKTPFPGRFSGAMPSGVFADTSLRVFWGITRFVTQRGARFAFVSCRGASVTARENTMA